MNLYSLREERVRQLIRTLFEGKQVVFAKAVDIDSTTVSRWFMKGRGRKHIGDRSAEKIEEKLNLPIGSLLSPGQESVAPQRSSVVRLPSLGAREGIASGWPFRFPRARFDALSDNEKGQVEGYVKRMIEEFEANRESGPQTRPGD